MRKLLSNSIIHINFNYNLFICMCLSSLHSTLLTDVIILYISKTFQAFRQNLKWQAKDYSYMREPRDGDHPCSQPESSRPYLPRHQHSPCCPLQG